MAPRICTLCHLYHIIPNFVPYGTFTIGHLGFLPIGIFTIIIIIIIIIIMNTDA